MDPIFEYPVFDSARENMKRFIRQLEKSQEAHENSLYTCFKCGSSNVFLLQNRPGLLAKERLYSTSVQIATINGEMDKQRLSESFFDSLKNNHLMYYSAT